MLKNLLFNRTQLESRNLLSSIQVFAAGQTGEEIIELSIDDIVVASWQLNAGGEERDFQSFNWETDGTVSADRISISFTNDLWNPDEEFDRNVWIDAIALDGERIETESPEVYSTGSFFNNSLLLGNRRTEQLHAIGSFQFGSPEVVPIGAIPPVEDLPVVDLPVEDPVVEDPVVVDPPVADPPSQSQSSIQVFAAGQTGEEIIELAIDDVPVVSWQLNAGSEERQFETFEWKNPDPVTAGQISISFTNDQWRPDEGFDRNVLIDAISLGGERIETESPEVYSTGAFVNGSLSFGNNQTEELVTFGSFQFGSPGVDPPVEGPRETGSFALAANFFIGSETEGAIDVQINRVNGSAGEASIDYETFDRTAIGGEDFTAQNGTLVFEDGEVSKTVSVPVLDDGIVEDSEQFSFVIDNAINAGLLAPRTATLEITNSVDEPTENPVDPEPSGFEFAQQTIGDLQGATSVDFLPDGTPIVAEFSGRVFAAREGQPIESGLILDISNQVNAVRGMTALTLHPDLENYPYLYLGYAYDPPEVFGNEGLAGVDGGGNRASRVSRFTLDAATNFGSVVEGSEVVIAGSNSTWENFNGFVDSTVDFDEPAAGVNADGSNVQDFLSVDSQTHTIGDLEFGNDGALYVSNGDGASFNAVDPRATRVQDIDNLSGKILRIDPITGEGLSDNPFFDGDPNSNQSKVYQSGLRNPFRITFSDSGQLFIGDVGWTQIEEINTSGPGANFGWPYFEGNQQTQEYSALPEAQAFYNSGAVATSPIVDLNHSEEGIDAIILGDYVPSDSNLPDQFDDSLLFNHLSSGELRAVQFDESGAVSGIDTVTDVPAFTVDTTIGPDGDLYYTDFGGGAVGKFEVGVSVQDELTPPAETIVATEVATGPEAETEALAVAEEMVEGQALVEAESLVGDEAPAEPDLIDQTDSLGTE